MLNHNRIVRLIWFLPVFCISSFFALWFYDAANYITPIPQLYNAFGIAALFYLYVVQVSPDASTWGRFYQQTERRWPTGKVKHNRGSFNWFMVILSSSSVQMVGTLADIMKASVGPCVSART